MLNFNSDWSRSLMSTPRAQKGDWSAGMGQVITESMSNNQVQPILFNGKAPMRESKRRFSVPETVSDSFEWVTKGGRGAKSEEVPIILFIQGLFAVSLIFIPSLIVGLIQGEIKAEDMVCAASDAEKSADVLDFIRICSVAGFGWASAVVVMAILHFTTILMKKSRRRDQSLHPSAQRLLEYIKFLGPYISLCVAFAVMSVMIKTYYPNSVDLAKTLSEFNKKKPVKKQPSTAAATPPAAGPPTEGATTVATPPEDATTAATAAKADNDKSDDDDTDFYKALNVIVAFLSIVLTTGSISNIKVFYLKNLVPIIINTCTIFFFVLLAEKAILQLIASHYRTATTAGRFTENAFALSVLKALYRTKINSAAIMKLGGSYDPDMTSALFDSLVDDNQQETISVHNLAKVMNQDQAFKLFNILDTAQNGDLTKEEFIAAVKAVYDEQETLTKLVTDHDDIISKIDEIMLFAVYSIDLALCLTFLGIPGVEMLKVIFGLIVALGVVFSDALKKLFDALVFVLITHPYDLGDRVEIDGKYLYVESVGLWISTFEGPGGLKTIMTNASLAHDKIANFRRSPAENETFSYLIRPETVTPEAVSALREDVLQFFKENNRDFLPHWHLETSDQIDPERFKIIVKIYHRHNFQNEAAKNERTQKFALYFKDALIRNGFVLSPPLPKALAVAL